MSFRKLLRQWFSSARRPVNNKRRSGTVRSKGWLQLERLEDRLAPATVSDLVGRADTTTLTIALAPSENLSIVSNGTFYQFNSNLDFTNSDVAKGNDFSGFGTRSLTLKATGISRYTTAVTITDNSGGGSSTVNFNDANAAAFGNNFNIDLSSPKDAITFIGATTFSGNNKLAASAPSINFQGGASVPYQGTVTFTYNSHSITMPSSGPGWAALGFVPGEAVTIANAPHVASTTGYVVQGVAGDTLTLAPAPLTSSAKKLPPPITDPNVTVAVTSAKVSAASVSLTSANSLTVQSAGVPYLGPVTINAAPPVGQPYQGDEFITGPDWGSYGYTAGDTITVAGNSSVSGTYTIASIAGDNLYLISSQTPKTGTYSDITVKNPFTPEIHATGNGGLTLNVTGLGSAISGAINTTALSGGTNNGNITLQDVDFSDTYNDLTLNQLTAGTARIRLDVAGSMETAYLPGVVPGLLTAGEVDLTTTGLSNANNPFPGIFVTTQTERLTATTNDAPIIINNTGTAPLTVDSVVADQGGQAPVVNDGQIEYNKTPSGTSPTYISGSNDVDISSTGPVVLNSISATGSVAVAGASILEGNDQKQNIVAQNVNLVATGPTTATYLGEVISTSNTLSLPSGAVPSSFTAGDTIFVSGAGVEDDGTFTVKSVSLSAVDTLTLTTSALQPNQIGPVTVAFGTVAGMAAADYQGQVTFANPTTPSGHDTLALPVGQNWSSWSGFGNLTAGDAITVSGASETVNDATFTVASVSGNILTLQQRYVLDPETEPLVTVSDCTIGLQDPSSSSSTNSGALALSQVANFTAATANGNINLTLGDSVDSTAVFLTAGGFGNVALSSQANFLTVENITAMGGTVPGGSTMMGGNVAVATNNGFLLEYPDSNGDPGSIKGQTVSLASAYNIGSPSSPIQTNAASALRVAATASSPSSAAVYVDNTSNLTSVGVSTCDGSVLVNYNYNASNSTYADQLNFSNNVLSESGSAVVAFANTNDTDGSGDNVLLSGLLPVSSISAGGQILAYNSSTETAPEITGGSVMLSAGSGIGGPGTYIATEIGSLDATTTTGSIYIQNNQGLNFQGGVNFDPPTAEIPVDQIELTNHSGPTWTSLGFAPGDTIDVSGASAAADNGAFTIASISTNGLDLSLTVSNVLETATNVAVTVYHTFLLSATTLNGNINVTSAGNIAVGSQTTGDVSSQGSATPTATLPGVSTGTSGGTITLTAGYSILNANSGGANGVDVSAGALVLTAASNGGIGTASNPLETAVSNLTANGGSLYAVNNTALTVTSTNTMGTSIAGNVSISTTGDLSLNPGNEGVSLGTTNSSVTLTATAGQFTTITPEHLFLKAAVLTITAEQIGLPTDFIQTNATTLNATANYGGIYISNDSRTPLTLTAVAVGPTPGGVPANNIDVYSAGSIALHAQTNTLTATTPAAVSNPGGNLTLVAGETMSPSGGGTQSGAGGSTITSPGGLIMSGLGSNTGFLSAGMSVSGPGIPTGDTIATVNPTGSSSGGEIQLTEPVTAVENGVTFTFVSSASGSAPINFTGNTTYYDIITGTIKDVAASVTPMLQTKTDTMEVAVGQPGSGNAGPEILTAAALAAGGTFTASSITIADLEFNGQPGTVIIPNSLTLHATDGPIVFLNPLDTISVTGSGSITIEADTAANAVAALGNLTTQGGNIRITADGNISIGTISAGTGNVSVNSTSGSIFSNNGGSLQITAGSTSLKQMGAGKTAGTGQNAGAPLNNSLAQLQLNAAQAIAAAAAASAQAAADQTTANAFKSELTSIGVAVTNDEQTYQANALATKNDANTVEQDQAVVNRDTDAVNGLAVVYSGLQVASAIVGIAGGFAAVDAAIVAEVPVAATVAATATAAIQLAGAYLNFFNALVNVGIVAAQIQLSVDSSKLSTDQGTAGTDQSHEDQAFAQLQADLDTQAASAAAYNFAEQAANSAAISAAQDQAAAQAASAQVSAASAQTNAQANAQAVAAGLAVASGSSPALGVTGGLLSISGQGGGAVCAPIFAYDAGVNIQSSPITVSANITSIGTVTLQAQSQPAPSAIPGDDLSLASGVTLYSAGSSAVPNPSVTLVAGDNVFIPSGATIQAGPLPGSGTTQPNSTIAIIGDANDDPNGAIVTVAGTLIAKSASIGVDPNSSGPDTFSITPSATTPISVTGGTGTDTLNFNALGLAVTISGNTITAAGMQPVTFTNIAHVNITDAANGGASLTLAGTLNFNNHMSLVGTGQGAGTYTLNGVSLSFSGVASFSYQAGGVDDTIIVTPPQVPWNMAVTVAGISTSIPSFLTYNSPVDSQADTVTANGADAGSIGSPGLAVVQFLNIDSVTINNASQNPGNELTVNLRGKSAADAVLEAVFQDIADIGFNGNFDLAMSGYAGLTINGNRGSYDLGNSSAALPMPLTLNTPDVQAVVNTGTTSTVNATASGNTISVTNALIGGTTLGQVEVAGLSGNVTVDVIDPQLVLNVPGNSDSISVAGNHPFTNGLYVYGNASFSDTLTDIAGSGDAVTVTPSSSTISETGASGIYGPVVYAGISNVTLTARGATSTLTIAGSAQAENFDFTPTAAGAGSFTATGPGAAANATPQFTYTGIGNGITVNGGASGSDQLELTCMPGNETIDAEQTAAGTLAFTETAIGATSGFTTPFNLTNIGSVSIAGTAGDYRFEVGVAPQVTPAASLNFSVVGNSIYYDQLLVEYEGSGYNSPGVTPGSGSVTVGTFITYQGVSIVSILTSA